MSEAASTTRKGPNPYLRTKIMTASPGQLRLMLIEGAIRAATAGRAGIAAGDHEAAFEGIARCQKILVELVNGLDPDRAPELVERISGLYTFFYLHLMTALRERDLAKADEVIRLLEYERETWSLLLANAGSAGPPAGQDDGQGVSVRG